MSSISQAAVEHAIQSYICPYMEADLVSSKAVKNIAISGSSVRIEVEFGFPAKGYQAELSRILSERLKTGPGVPEVAIDISSKIVSHAVQKGLEPIKGIKNIIAVASGKGGVGKSTTAVNLALALSAEGANVGILDADIYGPSQPRMLGVSGKPESKDGRTLEPMMSYHLQAMSIGFLVEEETPMIWRGPMVTQALEQLLKDTNWHDLEY